PGIIDSETGLFDPGVALQDTQYVHYSNPAGCDDSVRIVVYQFETAAITGLDSVYCFKDEDNAFSYTPGNGIFTGPTDSTIFNPDSVGAGVHMFTISHGLGVCKTEDSIQVTVHPQLIVSLSSTKDTICDGQGATLTATASGGEPTALYTYSWTQGLFPIETNAVNPLATTTYVVTVSDGCSDDAIDSVTIIIAENFSVAIDTSERACYGDVGYASATVTGTSSYDYAWGTSPVQTTESIVGTAGESYDLTITDINSGCKYESSVKIPSYSVIYAGFTVTPNVNCISFDQVELITIIDLSKNAQTGFWEFGEGPVTYVPGGDPPVVYTKPGSYPISLKVYNEGGCEDSHSEAVCIFDPLDLFVADAFSPNGDGSNDMLFVRGNGVAELDFVVYNRWGLKVFETHDINHGWDGNVKGQAANSEVFVYNVRAVSAQGTEIILKGDVSLVR
ncbi:MAG: gliding motility-associated C-terminal domain-containing protein, partial [Flavobacteriales bacterium]|nr:gliding motility-associated C-terminal domain-containing protein [Flavobacteriales bacterium]